MITREEYQDQYGDMLLGGLASAKTYIPLIVDKQLGINIAIRPYAVRQSENVVLFGGKLRVGYVGTDADTEIPAINYDTRVEQLQNFCKGFSWMKSDDVRRSTLVFVGCAASIYDGDTALESLASEDVASNFLKSLQTKYQKSNEGSFSGLRKASQALHDAWLLQSSEVFRDLPEVIQLPESVVGTTSEMLNQAQDTYTGNVVSFAAKVASLKAD